MIHIVVTGKETGTKALLYEFTKRQGRRTFVPTYKAVAYCSLGIRRFEFAVVRDSSSQVFGGLTDRYGEKGECPPSNGKPYGGIIREDGPKGFRVELFEEGLGHTNAILGQGTTLRRNIQIHFGAAASTGCLLVAGRRREYMRRFERPLRSMLAHAPRIEVVVQPRALPRP